MVSTGPFLIIPDIIRYGRYVQSVSQSVYSNLKDMLPLVPGQM
jgi:hypothetical protein